jgi:uncharacterized membrane protein
MKHLTRSIKTENVTLSRIVLKPDKHKMVARLSICHRLPHRSFFWKGKQFPLCARCTGIHLGYLSMPVFLFNLLEVPIYIAILIVLPTYLDGMRQHITKRESTNIVRVFTGFIAGVGTMSLISDFGQYVGGMIKTLI